MRPPSRSGDASAARNAPSTLPARQLEGLQLGFRTRLQPLLSQAWDAAAAELRKIAVDVRTAEQAEAIANLVVLRHDALRHERSWQQHLGLAFAGWPQPATRSAQANPFSLVSEGELHAQLIGQPAIEALERRFSDVLAIIDGRLCSLAAALGSRGRPANPFSPRVLVQAFLDTFSPAECDHALRPVLLRQYEKLCGASLTDAYAWLNAELAACGYAMDGASAGAALVSQPIATGGQAAWPGHDVLQATSSSWRRNAGEGDGCAQGRGKVLRDALRAIRREADVHAAGRDLSDQEFLSVLSLLQGSETPLRPTVVSGAISDHLREAMRAGAEGLGLPCDLVAPSQRQGDAIAAVGALFDRLRTDALLSVDAAGRLARLAWPWLRLALHDPDPFDDPGHPAMQLLAGIVECWDANPSASAEEAELHALADSLADAIANDYHGDVATLDTALGTLRAGRAAALRRPEISERRAWQSILGSERLQAAREEADALLAARLANRMLLPVVADFLCGAWRQSLIMAWLRDGPGSDRHAGIVAVGDGLMRIDEAAAAAQGGEVAEGLIALNPGLRACYAAARADAGAADDLLARLVAMLSQPDAPREAAVAMPLACDEASFPTAPATQPLALPAVGQVVIARSGDGKAAEWRRVAWISPVSGRYLLVNRQGTRQALLSAGGFEDAIARGALVARSAHGPVEAVLLDLAGEPTGCGGDDIARARAIR